MIRHSETAKMSRTSSFFTLGGQLASSGGRTLISDSLKLQLYQHRGQLNLLEVEVYLKPPHLNIALWAMRGHWFAYQWSLYKKSKLEKWVSVVIPVILKIKGWWVKRVASNLPSTTDWNSWKPPPKNQSTLKKLSQLLPETSKPSTTRGWVSSSQMLKPSKLTLRHKSW